MVPLVLDGIWNMSREALYGAEAAFVIGYSIPSYDDGARALLAEVLRRKRVILVDPNPTRATIDFLESVNVRDLVVLRQTSATFFENEMLAYDPLGLQVVSFLAQRFYNAVPPDVSRTV
jgi:hypothetical protein